MIEYGSSQQDAPANAGAAPAGERMISYDNTPSQKVEPQGESLLTGGHVTVTPTTAQKGQSDTGDADTGQQRPEIEFAPDGAGTAPASYDLHLNSLFDGRMSDAAVLDQHELKEQLTSARSALKQAFTEFQPGDAATREMIGVVNEYSRQPRGDEAQAQEREKTMSALQLKWGNDTSKMIQGAQRVLNEVCRRVPGMADTLADSGVLNNEKFIVHLANLAQKRYGKSTLNK